jgi:acyl-coenzyme A thioesterase PaaI-like protein
MADIWVRNAAVSSPAQQIELARRLASRLERLSADSIWAHRASGVRGSLLRWLDDHEHDPALAVGDLHPLDLLVTRAFEILTLAAKEIREPIMSEKAIQDFYPENVSYCYGCGRLNERGLQIKSYWLGDEAVCIYQPRPEHIAIPGYVYGGLIASLIDCHCTGTAAAASYHAAGRSMDSLPAFRFVTASLKVDYLKPTPLGVPLEIRARVIEIKGRKVVMQASLSAEGELRARGEVVAVQAPPEMFTE